MNKVFDSGALSKKSKEHKNKSLIALIGFGCM